jgi:hypothetical protein
VQHDRQGLEGHLVLRIARLGAGGLEVQGLLVVLRLDLAQGFDRPAGAAIAAGSSEHHENQPDQVAH